MSSTNLLKFQQRPESQEESRRNPRVSEASPGQLISHLARKHALGELSKFHLDQVDRIGQPLELDGESVRRLAEGSVDLLSKMEVDPDLKWTPQMLTARNSLLKTLHRVHEELRTQERYRQLETAVHNTIRRLCKDSPNPKEVQAIFEDEIEKNLTT